VSLVELTLQNAKDWFILPLLKIMKKLLFRCRCEASPRKWLPPWPNEADTYASNHACSVKTNGQLFPAVY